MDLKREKREIVRQAKSEKDTKAEISGLHQWTQVKEIRKRLGNR
jgi:hypothetical protein